MTEPKMKRICIHCSRDSCPSLAGQFGVCPSQEIDELTQEWLALLVTPDAAPQLARELASLSFNVRALQHAERKR